LRRYHHEQAAHAVDVSLVRDDVLLSVQRGANAVATEKTGS
jgi:hypothetical protein